MKKALLVSILLWTVVPAQGVYLNYSQWERLPESERGVYIAGAFDSIVTVVSSDADVRVSQHYHSCIVRAKMTNFQLANNVMGFARTRPELQRDNVQGALLFYLIELCGKPPS